MMTQEDYLLDNPQISDLSSGSHQEINAWRFKDLFREAMRLEISDKRGDWVPVEMEEGGPDVNIVSTDGFAELSETTNAVDAALAALSKKKGKNPPKIPKLVGGLEDPTSPGPTKAREKDEPIGRQRKPPPKPTPEQLQKMAQVSHFVGAHEEVDEPLEEGVFEAEVSDPETPSEPPETVAEEAPPPPRPKAPAPPRPQQTRLVVDPARGRPSRMAMNTEVPSEGIMIDGEEDPSEAQQEAIRRQRGVRKDPWAPNTDKVVEPHAKVTMGGKKKDGK